MTVLADADSVAREGAAVIAGEARAAVGTRGRFVMAVSGGHTPWLMLRALTGEAVPWERVHVVQVDERVAPAGHAERNLTHLQESLLAQAPLRPEQIHWASGPTGTPPPWSPAIRSSTSPTPPSC
jgi:6-phosphogluconolactonase/glucosamine-6-phosphate isomerase/deaminase